MKRAFLSRLKRIPVLGNVLQVFGEKRIIQLKPDNKAPVKGNVLISYITAPFRQKVEDGWPTSHSNYWECFQMARTYLDFGYAVDIIDWTDKGFLPKKNYDVFIDIHSNMERLAPFLYDECLKILHITGAHWLFQNHAEYARLIALQQRRGISLLPHRIVPPSLGIEYADCATIVGNRFAINTFAYANKPIHRIPVSSSVTFPWIAGKDFDACRRTFLWIGSSGLVHKGLDLVLEAFIDIKDCELHICGPVQDETDFVKAYSKELHNTANIKNHGWIDVAGPEFPALAGRCAAVVYPSCSEGTAGSVITCLHAGLIPIVSMESGVDTGDFGFLLRNNTTDDIKKMIRVVAGLSTDELRARSKKAWEFAQANHTREEFAMAYQQVVAKLLDIQGKG